MTDNVAAPTHACTRLPTSTDLVKVAQELLEPCKKEEAQKATVVRRWLKAAMGRWQADAVLSCYSEVCLRSNGVCSRYFVDGGRRPLKLRDRSKPF